MQPRLYRNRKHMWVDFVPTFAAIPMKSTDIEPPPSGAVKKTAALGRRQAQPTQLPLGLCAKGLSACPVKRNGIDAHECIDLANDIEHCGSCRNSCDDLDDGLGSLTCSEGKCVPHNTDGSTRTLAYRSASADDAHASRKKRHSRTLTGNNVKARVRALKPKRGL